MIALLQSKKHGQGASDCYSRSASFESDRETYSDKSEWTMSILSLRQTIGIILIVLTTIMTAIWFVLDGKDRASGITGSSLQPDECRFLKHLHLGASSYQAIMPGRLACMSPVRYFGSQKQHAIRYTASGSVVGIDEMRLSLRLGAFEQQQAINELARFGNSLSLPLTGRALPFSVIQALREGSTGYWDLDEVRLDLERQMLSPSLHEIQLVMQRKTYQ